MTATPRLVKSLTQVNTADAAVALGGLPVQADGQIARLPDGGYVVIWTDSSRTHNPNGSAIVGQQYDSLGNKVGGEVNISQFSAGDQFSPAITALPNGNVAIAFVDLASGDSDLYVRIFDPSLGLVRTDRRGGKPDVHPVDHSLRRRQLRNHLHGRCRGRHRHRGARRELHRGSGRPVRYRQSN
jgi:hypothetical protein